MVSKFTRIHVYELQLGMFVAELDIPWEESPFLQQGFEVETAADIKAVQKSCEYVYIDASRQKQARGAIKSASNTNLFSSYTKASDTFDNTSSLVKTVMDDIRFGNQLNVAAVKEAVSECVDRVIENPDAMMLFTQLKNRDEYTSQHSMNVCILSLVFARSLNYPVDKLNEIGICALMHDIGKMKVPDEILNKPDKLSEEESIIMRTHTVEGRNILMSARGIYSGTIDVAYAHHERLDGKGYPRALDASGISPYTRMVSIADTYDAITSDRVYKPGRLHMEAISILTKCRNTHFDGGLVIKFIDCIGIYPVGNPVKLSDESIGVVIKANPKNKTRPLVLKLLDKNHQPIKKTVLNLADPNCLDADNQAYKIVMVLPKSQFDFSTLYKQLNLKKWLQDAAN